MHKRYHILAHFLGTLLFLGFVSAVFGQVEDRDEVFIPLPPIETQEIEKDTLKEEKEILLPDQSPLIFTMAHDLLIPQIAEDDEMGPLSDEKKAEIKFLRNFFQAYQNNRPLESFFDPRVSLVMQAYLKNLGSGMRNFQQVRISQVSLTYKNMQFRLKFFYPQSQNLGSILLTGDLLTGYKILAFSVDRPTSISR